MKQKKFLDVLTGRDNTTKLNLYVTGGGYNSAFTAGMLSAIDVEGWTDEPHRFIGQSSGSFSLMYLLSGDTLRGAVGYWGTLPELLRGDEFINPWNLLNPFESVMDINYMVDEYFAEKHPIAWDKVLEHPANQDGRFLVQVLDAQAGTSVLLSHFTTPRSLATAIKASSWVPLLASIQPFHIPPDILKEMRVSDVEGNTLEYDELTTYDGQLANSFFGEIYRRHPDELHLVCTNIAKSARGKLRNPFGPYLLRLEKILSYVLFSQNFNALRSYHESMLNGGQRRDFDALDAETSDETNNIIGVFPQKHVDLENYTEHSMQQAVFSGFYGMYEALGLPSAKLPWQENV